MLDPEEAQTRDAAKIRDEVVVLMIALAVVMVLAVSRLVSVLPAAVAKVTNAAEPGTA